MNYKWVGILPNIRYQAAIKSSFHIFKMIFIYETSGKIYANHNLFQEKREFRLNKHNFVINTRRVGESMLQESCVGGGFGEKSVNPLECWFVYLQ